MLGMKQVIRYQCPHCKKEFKTADRHYCKKNPELKNCFSCKHLTGWEPYDDDTGHCYGPPSPICDSKSEDAHFDSESWDLRIMQQEKYNMQCPGWEPVPVKNSKKEGNYYQ